MTNGQPPRIWREVCSGQKEEQSQRPLGGNGRRAFNIQKGVQYGLGETNKGERKERKLQN